jgi:glycerol-3-phosphate dehydrogenase subunit C
MKHTEIKINQRDSVEISLSQCIKCNICTAVCPVSAVTDEFPGPKFAAPQAGRFRQREQVSPDSSVDYCSGCRVCNLACPAGVKIAEINSRARAVMVEQGKINRLLRFRNNIIARAELIGKFAQPVAPLANAALSSPLARILVERLLHIDQRAPLPTVSNQRFSNWFKAHRPFNGEAPRKKVAYFYGCSTQYFEPRVGIAAVSILEANGFEVILPRQNCCGLPLLSNGEFSAARRYHQNNVKSLVEYARLGIPIVGTSTSCTLTLKEEAPDLLGMNDEETKLVSKSVYDLNEFLVSLLQQDMLNIDLAPIPLKLPYHIPCQYRAHRIGRPGIEILTLIPGLQVEDSHADCCGIAGTYGYKSEKFDIAVRVGQPLFDFIGATEAPLVICDSETCRWQITWATGKHSVHPAELLAVSYGFPAQGILQNFIK